MNEIVIKKGYRELNIMRLKDDKFSVSDTLYKPSHYHDTISFEELLKRITEML